MNYYHAEAKRLIARDHTMAATARVCGQRATWRIARNMDDRYNIIEREVFRRALGIRVRKVALRKRASVKIGHAEVRHG